MSEFTKVNPNGEGAEGGPQRIVKMDFASPPTAKPYELRSLKGEEQGTYTQTKQRFGALAYTDPDRKVNSGKDGAFEISHLLREPLGIEAEEKRVVEERVQARLQQMMETEGAQARAEGFEEGRKQGFEAARQEFREEGSKKLERLDAMISLAEAARGEILRANERFIVSMIYRIARMILLRELTTDKEYVLRLARELIERVGVRENIRIRVNPREMETMMTVREGLDKHFGGLKNLQFDVSNEVSEGGCMLETEWNAIDATIDVQLKAIETSLLGSSGESQDGAGQEGAR